jgi:hypothetical protein
MSKDEKRKGKLITFWLTPGNAEHDYLLEAILWWRDKKADLSEKIRLGLLLVAYIDTGDVEGFMKKLPASFYNQLPLPKGTTASGGRRSADYQGPGPRSEEGFAGAEIEEPDADGILSGNLSGRMGGLF